MALQRDAWTAGRKGSPRVAVRAVSRAGTTGRQSEDLMGPVTAATLAHRTAEMTAGTREHRTVPTMADEKAHLTDNEMAEPLEHSTAGTTDGPMAALRGSQTAWKRAGKWGLTTDWTTAGWTVRGKVGKRAERWVQKSAE
jgi:hypothetical protein